MLEKHNDMWIFFCLALDSNSLTFLISYQVTVLSLDVLCLFRASNSPILIGCPSVNFNFYGITNMQLKCIQLWIF
jgi:hypothetical protein